MDLVKKCKNLYIYLHSTTYIANFNDQKIKSVRRRCIPEKELDDALPSCSNLRKDLEAVSNHSARRHGGLLLTFLKGRLTDSVVGSDVWAADNDSLRGSEEGDNDVEESGSHCR